MQGSVHCSPALCHIQPQGHLSCDLDMLLQEHMVPRSRLGVDCEACREPKGSHEASMLQLVWLMGSRVIYCVPVLAILFLAVIALSPRT